MFKQTIGLSCMTEDLAVTPGHWEMEKVTALFRVCLSHRVYIVLLPFSGGTDPSIIFRLLLVCHLNSSSNFSCKQMIYDYIVDIYLCYYVHVVIFVYI